MNIYLIHCDFKPNSDAWFETAKILNSYEGKRHRPDSWFILTPEPVSIVYSKFKDALNDGDFILITKISHDFASNYPTAMKNWINAHMTL